MADVRMADLFVLVEGAARASSVVMERTQPEVPKSEKAAQNQVRRKGEGEGACRPAQAAKPKAYLSHHHALSTHAIW
mgnify:CR=1 FL=1